jgi:quercetin dioxygenase-like cupin family protein
MTVRERFIVDPGDFAWEGTDRPERVGQGFRLKRLANGRDGGPYVIFGIQPENFVNPAHFHDMPQFQVLLEGTVKFPIHQLSAPAVHYSDRNSPYGPFVPGRGFVIGVFRNGPAEQIYMSDREGRKRRVPGREHYGQSADLEWSLVPGHPDLEQQVLIDPAEPGVDGEGPQAVLIRLRPGAQLPPRPAPHGRFEVVLDGTLLAPEGELSAYSSRYTLGPTPPKPIAAGPAGATVLTLRFDGS